MKDGEASLLLHRRDFAEYIVEDGDLDLVLLGEGRCCAATAQPTQSNAVPNRLNAYLPFMIPSHGLEIWQDGSCLQLALELVYEASVRPLGQDLRDDNGPCVRQEALLIS
jgi:hypothetical protein